ncbi:MAG: hypothetical protein KAH54_05380, partial [Candidatus Sabulitectum sp.]|nr:hypothetical protein [Candidatus Sabulitectum sp.]
SWSGGMRKKLLNYGSTFAWQDHFGRSMCWGIWIRLITKRAGRKLRKSWLKSDLKLEKWEIWTFL